MSKDKNVINIFNRKPIDMPTNGEFIEEVENFILRLGYVALTYGIRPSDILKGEPVPDTLKKDMDNIFAAKPYIKDHLDTLWLPLHNILKPLKDLDVEYPEVIYLDVPPDIADEYSPYNTPFLILVWGGYEYATLSISIRAIFYDETLKCKSNGYEDRMTKPRVEEIIIKDTVSSELQFLSANLVLEMLKKFDLVSNVTYGRYDININTIYGTDTICFSTMYHDYRHCLLEFNIILNRDVYTIKMDDLNEQI